mmetsp:Transcript_108780/g.307561  ORF Transcript_108780/g.307561 Transcript_108780/m.307561 type:complete len:194 (-) Transcript_108780:11-592(-)
MIGMMGTSTSRSSEKDTFFFMYEGFAVGGGDPSGERLAPLCMSMDARLSAVLYCPLIAGLSRRPRPCSVGMGPAGPKPAVLGGVRGGPPAALRGDLDEAREGRRGRCCVANRWSGESKRHVRWSSGRPRRDAGSAPDRGTCRAAESRQQRFCRRTTWTEHAPTSSGWLSDSWRSSSHLLSSCIAVLDGCTLPV